LQSFYPHLAAVTNQNCLQIFTSKIITQPTKLGFGSIRHHQLNSKQMNHELALTIIDSHTNGQRSQAKQQYLALTKYERETFISYLFNEELDIALIRFFFMCEIGSK
jgi:hypothetical protein